MEDSFRIGVITQPHGIKGEVKVYPTTDEPERFTEIDTVMVQRKRGTETMEVEGVKYFKGMVILKLSGIHSMDEAETYRQAELYIRRDQSSPCKEGEYFIADLIGLSVKDEQGNLIGEVTDVLQTGANDVFEVRKTDGRELLLPKIPSCILNVDIAAGEMTVYVLPGLED